MSDEPREMTGMDDVIGVDSYTVAKDRLASFAEPKKGQRYRHYKGGTYEVVSVSIMEDTLRAVVTYRSLDNPHEVDTTRTLGNFRAKVTVTRDGLHEKPRFERIKDEVQEDH